MQWDLEQIALLMKACGGIALKYYDNPFSELKEDHSVVTMADREIEAMLTEAFEKPEDDSYMIGEETVATKSENYLSSAMKEKAWIVDPIDGTAPYSGKFPMWGISIAYAEGGVIKEGALYLPESGDFLISDGEKVYHEASIDNETWQAGRPECEFKPCPKKLDDGGIVSISQNTAKRGGFKAHNPVHAVASCVYSITGLLLGRYLAYTGTVKLWDMAAGLALLDKCGFKTQLQSSGMTVSTALDEHFYFLAANEPKRWCVRDDIIFAPNEEIIDFIRKNVR